MKSNHRATCLTIATTPLGEQILDEVRLKQSLVESHTRRRQKEAGALSVVEDVMETALCGDQVQASSLFMLTDLDRLWGRENRFPFKPFAGCIERAGAARCS